MSNICKLQFLELLLNIVKSEKKTPNQWISELRRISKDNKKLRLFNSATLNEVSAIMNSTVEEIIVEIESTNNKKSVTSIIQNMIKSLSGQQESTGKKRKRNMTIIDVISDDEEEFSVSNEEELAEDTDEDSDCEGSFKKLKIIPKTKEDKEFIDIVGKRSNKPVSLEQYFMDCSKDNKKEFLNNVKEIVTTLPANDEIFVRIIKADIPVEVKAELWNRVELNKFDKMKPDSDTAKFMEWFDSVITFPFNKISENTIHINRNNPGEVKKFLENARNSLDSAVYGHKEPKEEIIKYLAQKISNPSSNGKVMGLQGPMGNGKTTLIEKGISKILGRPFVTIPLGGMKDSSYLNGHQYTYVGATYGMIVNQIRKSGCINPVIYLDELDKVSNTEHGQEIINLLIHLIDPSQNTHFRDLYFGNFDIDLSNVMWIFSFNSSAVLNPILRDRISVIHTEGFMSNDKICIAKKYLLPSICKEYGIRIDIEFETDTLMYMIEELTYEAGVRQLKQLLTQVIADINLNILVGKEDFGKKKKKVYVTIEDIKRILNSIIPVPKERIGDVDKIGSICGMYADGEGTGGGVMPFETSWYPTTEFFPILMTGNMGKIMTESINVSKNLAWKLTPEETQKEYIQKWKKDKMYQGIHIHSFQAACEKDGPSAGTALTVLIYSLLNKIPIRRDVSITGEINLNGDVLAIGGLKYKLFGAKKAGVRLALYPITNQPHVDQILKEHPELIDNTFDVKAVTNIHEVFKLSLKKY